MFGTFSLLIISSLLSKIRSVISWTQCDYYLTGVICNSETGSLKNMTQQRKQEDVIIYLEILSWLPGLHPKMPEPFLRKYLSKHSHSLKRVPPLWLKYPITNWNVGSQINVAWVELYSSLQHYCGHFLFAMQLHTPSQLLITGSAN